MPKDKDENYSVLSDFPECFILKQSMARLTADMYPSQQMSINVKCSLKGNSTTFTHQSVSSIEEHHCICVKSSKSQNKVFVEQTLSAVSLQINIKVQ